MYRFFSLFVFTFLLNMSAWASDFEKMQPYEIKEMEITQFRSEFNKMTPELFLKLNDLQKMAIKKRALAVGLKMPIPQVNPSKPNEIKQPFKPISQKNTITKINAPVELSFDYKSSEKILDALMKNPESEHTVFERDIPLSGEYDRLESNKISDPFYQTIQNFDFQKDFMVIYNNDAYWKGINKERPPSTLVEGKDSFHGEPLMSQWTDSKNQTRSDPVGYHLFSSPP